VRLAVLAMLSRPDVSDLAVVSIGIGLASYVAVMTDFGFKNSMKRSMNWFV
jgi:hypothetical protein